MVNNIMRNFLGKLSMFPGRYLGLPLHTRKLRKLEVQPLVDKIGARLPDWIGKFLSSTGRETLVKTVLSSLPIYHLTVFQVQKWLIKKIDRIRRSFLWRGETTDRTSGGYSLIYWATTCLPKSKGGLGILDMDRFTRVLGSSGCGFNGSRKIERGLIWKFLVIEWIKNCSMLLPLLLLAMARWPLSGCLVG
jgi:hypothetical protein